MTSKQKLESYVEDFRNWRKANYTDQQIHVNIPDDPSYPNWDSLEIFFSELLDNREIAKLDFDSKVNLIYLIARGWDCRGFLYDSDQMPFSSYGLLEEQDFIDLAKVALALSGSEYGDAKSIFANSFGKLNSLSPEAEEILMGFYNDGQEYTKRMALFSLAKLGYKYILDLVQKSWIIDDEWHKMGCLHVLDKFIVDKSILQSYLDKIVGEEKPYLSAYALELKQKINS